MEEIDEGNRAILVENPLAPASRTTRLRSSRDDPRVPPERRDGSITDRGLSMEKESQARNARQITKAEQGGVVFKGEAEALDLLEFPRLVLGRFVDEA